MTYPHSRGARRRPALVGALSVTLLFAGCSSADPETGDGEVELTFMNQSRGQEAALQQLAEQYTEETGVRIAIDSPGPADYLPRLQARAQSGDMPDVYSSFNAQDMAAFYRAGWALDLTEELAAGWEEDFSPAVVEMSTFEEGNNLDVEPGIYTVHWETQTYGFHVNPELTDLDTETPPTTTGELIDGLTAAGGDNLSVAASLSPELIQGLASNWLSDEEIAATFNGEASWEQEGWQNAFEFLVELRDEGVIANGALPGGQDDNPNVEASFFTQQMGVIFGASPGVS